MNDGSRQAANDEPEQAQPEPLELLGEKGLRLRGWARGRGPVRVLLLHGVGDHGRIWDPVAAALPAEARSLAIDLRGHGDSEWSGNRAYARADFTRDLEAVVEQLRVPLVLIGHSLGGSLAMEFAARHPERVSALCLLDVGPRMERPAVQRLKQGLTQEYVSFPSEDAYLEHLRGRYWLAEPAALRAFAAAGLHRGGAGLVPKLDPAARQVLRDRDEGRDAWEELRRIACPTLVVRAAGSAVLARETARRMVFECLTDGSLEEVPRAGHALLLDNPGAVGRVLHRFVMDRIALDAPSLPGDRTV